MTLNTNWRSRAHQAAELAERRRRYQRRAKRRWSLLTRFHQLPERSWEATHEFGLWLQDEWLEVVENYEQLQEYSQKKPLHDPKWLAFAAGGAAAFLRGYDLPPVRVAEFLAGAIYVSNRRMPAADARVLFGNAQALVQQMRGELAAIYRTGKERAEWRLECRREREGCEAPPLVETTGDEPEPPGFCDLVDLDIAHGQRAIH
jgi:hypothetical protein